MNRDNGISPTAGQQGRCVLASSSLVRLPSSCFEPVWQNCVPHPIKPEPPWEWKGSSWMRFRLIIVSVQLMCSGGRLICVPINTADGMPHQSCQSQGQFLIPRALSDTSSYVPSWRCTDVLLSFKEVSISEGSRTVSEKNKLEYVMQFIVHLTGKHVHCKKNQ